MRKRLSYYERYLRDSRNGDIEVIPVNERLESAEWQRQHPSVGEQEWFALKRKKAAWDLEMSALVLRRREWDLPSELPEAPPPPEADAA